jgi:uridine phosphorylase
MSTSSDVRPYHIGFGKADLPPETTVAFLSGDPHRSTYIANEHLFSANLLSDGRGLTSWAANLPGGRPVVCATSGMGAPSASIVINELAQIGITTIIRIGTSGSIQRHVEVGSLVIAYAALCRQGAAQDIAPTEYPAAADPFLTVALSQMATRMGTPHQVGIVASVDTFFEGQGRTASSANPHLLRTHEGMIDEYARLGILSFEMEAGTLFKIGGVYGLQTACVLAIIAQRNASEDPDLTLKDQAIDSAIRLAVATADAF